tara:strand:- start:2575 stop:3933 length:1359 start_codon:yes stop_codon:yes gene_type:complete
MRFQLAATLDESQAHHRCQQLATMAKQLCDGGHAALAPRLLERAGLADEEALATVLEAARRLCQGEAQGPMSRPNITFREFGEQWTSGALNRRWPDQVKKKKTAKADRQRLEKHVYGLIGHIPVAEVTLDHAEAVMAALPNELKPATRWQVAQVIHRVLSLAVYPARLIESSPLPKGFMPNKDDDKAFSFLYPGEDEMLMGTTTVPLAMRVYWGFLAREGMRAGEAVRLTWADLDLVRGAVRLDENKTGDPRAWALDPGVTRALRRYHQMVGAGAGDLVFLDPEGKPLDSKRNQVRPFRRALKEAGVDRPELFERNDRRVPIRVHDLRATFITISLANGKTETWVADRTGHKSSVMINGYRRGARRVSELGLGTLKPLDQAIPELRPDPGKGHEKASRLRSGSSEPRDDFAKAQSSQTVAEVGLEPTCPCGQRILNPPRLPFRHSAVEERRS